MSRPFVFAIAAASCVLCGCGTTHTDPVALAFANHTVKLMGEAEKSAALFRDTLKSAQDERLKAMAEQNRQMRLLVAAQEVRYRARESAGDVITTAIRDRLMADADHASKLDEGAAGADISYGSTVAALLQPLPNPSPALTEAQAKAAAMGQELSAATRRAETLGFYEAVLKSIKENKDRIDTAKAAAAATAASGNSALTSPK